MTLRGQIAQAAPLGGLLAGSIAVLERSPVRCRGHPPSLRNTDRPACVERAGGTTRCQREPRRESWQRVAAADVGEALVAAVAAGAVAVAGAAAARVVAVRVAVAVADRRTRPALLETRQAAAGAIIRRAADSLPAANPIADRGLPGGPRRRTEPRSRRVRSHEAGEPAVQH